MEHLPQVWSVCFKIVNRHLHFIQSKSEATCSSQTYKRNSSARSDAWGLHHKSGLLCAGLIVPSQGHMVDLGNKGATEMRKGWASDRKEEEPWFGRIKAERR